MSRDRSAVALAQAMECIRAAREQKKMAVRFLQEVDEPSNEVRDAIMLLRAAQLGQALPLIEWVAELLAKAGKGEDRDD